MSKSSLSPAELLLPSDIAAVTNPEALVQIKHTPREVTDVEFDASCPNEWRQAIVELLSFQHEIPAASGSNGRSLHVVTKAGERIKLKGVAGFDSSIEPPQVVLPQPQVPFADNQRRHVGVNADVTMKLVPSSPRFLHSLAGANATQEFIAHQRLAVASASRRPLARVLFNEFDAAGRQTGAVAARLPPGIELAHYTSVPTFQPPGSPELFVLGQEDESILAESYWANHAQIYQAIGSTRRRALEIAGIGRHSGHHGNIFISKDTGVEFYDLDSTVNIRNLHQPERSVQVLRDITSDLVRSLFSISVTFMGANAYGRLYQASDNPFLGYIDGFFGADIDEIDLVDGAAEISGLLQYQLANNPDIIGIYGNMVRAFMAKDFTAYDGYRNNFLLCFYQLWPHVMAVMYSLLQASGLPDKMDLSYTQRITPQLQQQWQKVCNEFVHLTRQESRGEVG